MRWLLMCWKTSTRFRLGIILLLAFVVLAVIGPLLYGPLLRGDDFAVNPAAPGNFRRWQPFSARHPLGTDGDGRDLMGAYLLGLSTSLRIGLLSGLVASAYLVPPASWAGDARPIPGTRGRSLLLEPDGAPGCYRSGGWPSFIEFAFGSDAEAGPVDRDRPAV